MKQVASIFRASPKINAAVVRNKTKKIGWSVVRGVILLGLCFEILYPFLVKILQSFMSRNDLTDPTVSLFPREWSTQYVVRAFEDIHYFSTFLNTLLLSLVVSLLQVCICTMVGYGFARFKFRLRGALFVLVIVTLVVPSSLYSSSLYMYFRFFPFTENGLLGTLWPFVLLSLTGLGMKNGLYIFLMRQFFRGLPKELEDAAYIDGCGVYSTYFRVILPNARNMLITVFALSFAWQWTDVFYSSLFALNKNMQTLPLAIINNIQEIATGGERLGATVRMIEQNAACIMAIIPLMLLFAFLQKQLIGGIERSGLVE